jgi:hypothetical protein
MLSHGPVDSSVRNSHKAQLGPDHVPSIYYNFNFKPAEVQNNREIPLRAVLIAWVGAASIMHKASKHVFTRCQDMHSTTPSDHSANTHQRCKVNTQVMHCCSDGCACSLRYNTQHSSTHQPPRTPVAYTHSKPMRTKHGPHVLALSSPAARASLGPCTAVVTAVHVSSVISHSIARRHHVRRTPSSDLGVQ